MVESEESRKARKEHEVESHDAGIRATLAKGAEMDAEHNRKVIVEKIRSAAEILREAREMVEETGSVETIVEDDADAVPEADAEAAEEAAPGSADTGPEPQEAGEAEAGENLTPENETMSELEQLKARIAELEAREEEE